MSAVFQNAEVSTVFGRKNEIINCFGPRTNFVSEVPRGRGDATLLAGVLSNAVSYTHLFNLNDGSNLR